MAASRWRERSEAEPAPRSWHNLLGGGRATEHELIPLFVFLLLRLHHPCVPISTPTRGFCFFFPGMLRVLEALISVLFQCFGWFSVCPMCILSVFTCFQIASRWWKIIYLLDCNFRGLCWVLAIQMSPWFIYFHCDCMLRTKGALVWFTVFLGQTTTIIHYHSRRKGEAKSGFEGNSFMLPNTAAR